MKLLLLFLLSLSSVSGVFAQMASDCYYPQVGAPGVIDTIYGNYSGQELGGDVFNPGPIARDGSRIFFIEGLPENPPFLTSLKVTTPFDLHNRQIATKTAFSRLGMISELGHFRDSKHADIIAISAGNRDNPRIYWSDDDGNFDSTRFTLLKVPKKNGYITVFSSDFPCYGQFTTDTVSDVILSVSYGSDSLHDYSHYLAFYKGGGLYTKSDTAYADTLELDTSKIALDGQRTLIPINSQISPLQDLIGINRRLNEQGGNWYYYQNEGSFSLKNILHSMKYDTLLAAWQNPKIQQDNGGKPLHLFPKAVDDNSTDLLCSFETSGPNGTASLYFFRGGQDFGSKRLFIDSADFIFHTVRWYSSTYFGWYIESLYEVGDMTGTGNPVLHTFAGDANGNSHEFFYVMGKAMDDKVDMFYESSPYGAGGFDTLDANGDGKMDLIEGMYRYVTPEDLGKGKSNVGSVHLVYGSEKIPVHLNPDYAVEEMKHLRQTEMYAFPNPFEERTVLTFENCSRGVMYMDVVNTLGQSVLRETLPDVDGYQQYSADLSTLAAGAYYIRLVCPADGWSATASVIKTGAAQAAWKFDLHELVK